MSAALQADAPDTLALARLYAARGWSVIPVTPGQKIPAVAWARYQHERADDAQLARWFAPGSAYGVGIVTGAISNLVVLDFDGEEGQATRNALEQANGGLPVSVEAITPRHGAHVLLAHPGCPVPTRKGVRPGMDVRGDGGFIVAAPSVHENGRRYEWNVDNHPDEVAVADCPGWVVETICGTGQSNAGAAASVVREMRSGPLGLPGARVTDGRETYMRDTVLACLRELRDRDGALPTVEQLFHAAWPQYARNADLSRPGRGADEVRRKCEYTLNRVRAGALHVAAGAPGPVPGAEPGQAGTGAAAEMARPASPGLPLVYFNDVQPNLDAADFVEGLLIEGGMSVIYGESNCGKTFFMTDLGLHVAMLKPWRGREVERGAVIYCALEGSHGISNRVAAFRKHHSLEGVEIPFAVVPSAINMLDPGSDTDRLIAAIGEAAEHLGERVLLVVIDTLSRALAGGNENAPDDMGALVSNTDRVRQATGAHVAYVHHSGKDTAKGARGHSLLRAATDTEIEVSRPDKDSPSVARVTKQREMEIEGEFVFRLQTIDLGANRRGKPVTSCVVVEVDEEAVTARDSRGQSRLSPSALSGLKAFQNTMARTAALLPPGPDYPSNTHAVAEEEWRKEFYRTVPVQSKDPSKISDARRQAFHRAQKELLNRSILAMRDGYVWAVRRENEGVTANRDSYRDIVTDRDGRAPRNRDVT